MFGHLRDPGLPVLETLGPADLDRIAGAAGVRLLRLRHRSGERPIMHVAWGAAQVAGQGAIWIYPGDKTQRLARRIPGARLDAASGALFQAFPQDHRMPLLAAFLANAMPMAQGLIGGAAARPPELVRYRPVISATFRWIRHDGQVFYVKQTPGEDVTALAQATSHLGQVSKDLPIRFAPVAGFDPGLGLIACRAAQGQSLDTLLPGAGPRSTARAMAQVTCALRLLGSLPIVPLRILDRAALIRSADHAAQAIALFDPDSGQGAAEAVARLEARAVPMRLRPIHADLKLEHVFLSGPVTTLIDTESLFLGDPAHDLAQLEARLCMARAMGRITDDQAKVSCREIRSHAGPDHDWFLTCARLQCARFFAQRFDPAAMAMMREVLAP